MPAFFVCLFVCRYSACQEPYILYIFAVKDVLLRIIKLILTRLATQSPYYPPTNHVTTIKITYLLTYSMEQSPS